MPEKNDHELAMMAASKAVSQSLAQKIANLADAIGERDPEEETKGNGPRYKYHPAKAVYGWWRAPMQRMGIILIPKARSVRVDEVTVEDSRGKPRHTWLTTIMCDFEITDGHETIRGSAVGQGDDPGDKGAGKAMTYAEKNFLLGLGMNGSEQDVEADERTNDRYYGTGRFRGDRYADDGYGSTSDDDREERNKPPRESERVSQGDRSVVIGDSNIEGIQRGGRASHATDAQIRRLRDLGRDLDMDARDHARAISKVLGDNLELPDEGEGDPGEVLRRYLTDLSADDIGKLIQNLVDGGFEPKNGGR